MPASKLRDLSKAISIPILPKKLAYSSSSQLISSLFRRYLIRSYEYVSESEYTSFNLSCSTNHFIE